MLKGLVFRIEIQSIGKVLTDTVSSDIIVDEKPLPLFYLNNRKVESVIHWQKEKGAFHSLLHLPASWFNNVS